MSITRLILLALAIAAGPATASEVAPRARLSISTPVEQPVALQSVRIDTEIAAGLARTSVELVFHNPNRRELEGELAFALAEGQTISGFAMELDGALREAVPVDKTRGRIVFEDITRERIDPALLEATAANHYRVRVYPILPLQTKRVVVRYDESLDEAGGTRRVRIPVDYGDRLPAFTLDVVVRGGEARPRTLGRFADDLRFARTGDGWRARMAHSDHAVRGVVEVALPLGERPQIVTEVRDGIGYFVADVPVSGASGERRRPRVVGIVWDSSGSGAARDHARELALLDAWFANVGDVDVRLVRLRERADAPEPFRVARGEWSALRRALEATDYDGATNPGAFRPERDVDEYLVFSDGLATLGDAPFEAGHARVHAIAAVAAPDAARLRAIAHASGGRYIDLTSMSARAAASRLLHDEPRVVALDGDGVGELVAASPWPERGRLRIAGVVTAPSAELRIAFGRDRRNARTVRIRIDASAASGLAASSWARLRLAALDADPALHRAAIRDLGRRFGLVTRETSLIVLDRVEDYVRFDIAPPPELADAFARVKGSLAQQRRLDEAAQIERVVGMLRQKQAWWARDFPKGERPAPAAHIGRDEHEGRSARRDGAAQLPAAPAAAAPSPARRPGTVQPDAAGKSIAGPRPDAGATAIRLQRWTPDAPYIARLRGATTAALYRVYLEQKPAHAASTAFFLDAADELFERGEHALGVRVLGNLAELALENRHLLRILAYRLLQAGETRLALPVLRRVLALSPEEPQSWRDLGLAYAADRQWQRAVDNLHEVVKRPWHGRFPEVELIALAELNAIVATCGESVDTTAIDPRLLANLPVDLRVVLAWDADNTDIDLWVTDPNGERAYCGNALTFQGGRMSRDFTGGYGPEEFSLKVAKPGRYVVEAHFFGHRQQIVAGATTLQVKFQTRFGTPEVAERAVTLRLQGRGGRVAVGEFEVR